MRNLIVSILILCVSSLFAGGVNETHSIEIGYRHLNISPSGEHLVYSIEKLPGLYINNLVTNKTTKISAGRNSAMQVSWSADSRYLGFKYHQEINGIRLQIPALIDVIDNKIIPLSQPVPETGIPSISTNGMITYSIGRQVIIKSLALKIIKELTLPEYANQTPIAPNGKFIVYNDEDDRMWLMDLYSENSRELLLPEGGYFEPEWSPDSRYILFTSLDRNLIIYDIQNDKVRRLGAGIHGDWSADSKAIVYSQIDYTEATSVDRSRIIHYSLNGTTITVSESSALLMDYPIFSSANKIVYSERKEGKIFKTTSFKQNMNKQSDLIEIEPNTSISELSLPQQAFISKIASVLAEDVFDIPYVNQRYDTPDEYNGNSACGATAAIMCIAYYNLVEPWPITVSWPYSHTSNYGNYIMNIYTHKGYTFDIWAYDPNDKKAYGGFGHIVRNNPAWADTKGNMADYARKHGLDSDVDWSPSRSKLMDEVSQRTPFVLLNSLTSSGHYISVIGYKNDAKSVIVNDPYGNKNNGYANFYGQRSVYDWPGYDYNNENLNTVHCYIYFRGTVPGYSDLEAISKTEPDTLRPGQSFPYSVTVYNYGDSSSSATDGKLYFVDTDKNKSQIASVNIPQLSYGDSVVFDINVQLADSLVSGNDYNLEFIADPEYQNEEMMWNNNSYQTFLTIEGYPEIYYYYPENNAQITTPNPTIKASFKNIVTTIVSDSVRMYLDGTDITSLASVSARSVRFTAHEGLSIGNHFVKVHVVNKAGYKSKLSWQFEITDGTAIGKDDIPKPLLFRLNQNYPNPFNNSTRIGFSIPTSGMVSMKIYDTSGRLIKTIANTNLSAGTHFYNWDSSNNNGQLSASGIYFVSLEWNGQREMRRILLIK